MVGSPVTVTQQAARGPKSRCTCHHAGLWAAAWHPARLTVLRASCLLTLLQLLTMKKCLWEAILMTKGDWQS